MSEEQRPPHHRLRNSLVLQSKGENRPTLSNVEDVLSPESVHSSYGKVSSQHLGGNPGTALSNGLKHKTGGGKACDEKGAGFPGRKRSSAKET